MLREDVYPYDYMHEQANSNEPLPEKEEFFINFKKKDIADADHMHAKRVCKDFSKKIR